jgi:hypothetical protein
MCVILARIMKLWVLSIFGNYVRNEETLADASASSDICLLH